MTTTFGQKSTLALQATMKENPTPELLAKIELQYLWEKTHYLFVTLTIMSCTYAAENPVFMSQSNLQTTYFTF